MEPTPARHGERTRRVASEDDLLAGRLQVGIGNGNSGQEGDGVRVQRLPVQVVGGGELDKAAEVHHADTVGDMADDGEVVGDEHQREVEAILEVDEEVDDLRLDRHVERRDRLVGEDDGRLDGQRPGQADALALAAGELVRIAVGGVGGKPDEAEQLVYPSGDVVAVGRAAARPAGVDERLGDQPAHAESRIETGVRVLEDELDASPVVHQIAPAQVGDVLAVEVDAPLERHEVDEGVGERALATTGLTDEADRLASVDRQRHPVDCGHLRAAERAAALDREA